MALKEPELLIMHSRCPVTSYLDYRDYLQQVYGFFKQERHSYSYMQMSEDLGFKRTNTMYLLIKGHRPLSLANAKKIAKTLKLTDLDRLFFCNLVSYQLARSMDEREQIFQKIIYLKNQSLPTDALQQQLEFFSEWYHAAIYELVALDSFKSDVHWIKDQLRLMVKLEAIEDSLKLLEKLDLIRYDKKKQRHIMLRNRVLSGEDVGSIGLVRYHQKMIDQGRDSLMSMSEKLRDVSGVTISIPQDHVHEFKKEIRRFRSKLMAKADALEKKDTVFQVNFQLFPLSKKAGGDW